MKTKSIVSKACDRCKTKKRRCDGEQPCVSCHALDIQCTYEIQQKKRGPVPQSERVKRGRSHSPLRYIKRREEKRYSRIVSDSEPDSEDFDELDTDEECESDIEVEIAVQQRPQPKMNKSLETVDIKNMIQNYTVTSSVAKIITNQQLLESVSEFFSTFNATLPIFENPAEIIEKILTNALPISLLSSIVSVGAASKDHISDLTSSILAQLAHSNLFEIATTSELIHTVLLLQYHELGTYDDSNAWIYNGIATNLINQNSLRLNSNTTLRLRKSVIVSDFFHGFITSKPFQITTSPSSVEESLVTFFDDITERCSSDYLEALFQLVVICKRVFSSQESLSNHHTLLGWYDNHPARLTPSLNALSCGGKILMQEQAVIPEVQQDPANILCHLLFFRSLSGIHQINHSLQPGACVLYPTSSIDQHSCLATSLDILAASYRAQNILLGILYKLQTQIHSTHVFALCYLPELLIPCAEPLMSLAQYSHGMLIGTRTDPTFEYGKPGIHDLTPLSALFVPALDDNAKVWPVVLGRVRAFKRMIEAAKVELVFGSAITGAAIRESGVELYAYSPESTTKAGAKVSKDILGLNDENISLGGTKLSAVRSKCGNDLSDKELLFCDSLLDFS